MNAKPTPPADLPSGRAAGAVVVLLLATVAIALAFVDTSSPSTASGAPLELLPGFYALAGLFAAMGMAMLARLLRIVLGRAPSAQETGAKEGGDGVDRA